MPKKKTEEELELQPVETESAEQQNIYTYQTSSTTEALMNQEDFYKIKLTS